MKKYLYNRQHNSIAESCDALLIYINSSDMISRKKTMQSKSKNCSLGLIQTVHGQQWKVHLCHRPLAPAQITFHDIEIPENIHNCTNKEERIDTIIIMFYPSIFYCVDVWAYTCTLLQQTFDQCDCEPVRIYVLHLTQHNVHLSKYMRISTSRTQIWRILAKLASVE